MSSDLSPPPTSVFRPDIPHLPSFPYKVAYDHFRSLRYAYIDEAPALVWDTQTGKQVDEAVLKRQQPDATVEEELILCLHGEPTWSYLYRKMIPGFLYAPPAPRSQSSGPRYIKRRLLAPDFIGFGRSDKPTDDAYYTWESHRAWLLEFVAKHVVSHSRRPGARVTLVVQDWGGILGLILPVLFPYVFTHMIVMNTALGLGVEPTKGWIAFRDFMAKYNDVDIGDLLKRGTPVSEEEMDAYRAPFAGPGGGERAKGGVRRFPQLVPIKPWQEGVAESHAALNYYANLCPVLESDSTGKGEKRRPLQVFVCIGESDPVLGTGVMDQLNKATWGKRLGFWRTTIPEAGHFVQEWASHIPQLSDIAWSSKEGNVRFDEDKEGKTRAWNAEWRQPELKADARMGAKL